MTEKRESNGKCLCGKVTIKLEEKVTSVGACHCTKCRRWGGGPFLAVHGGGRATLDGEEHIMRYRSSDWAERAFCRHCGTHLFYRLLSNNETVVLAGLLEDQKDFKLDTEIFVDEKPDWYDFSNKTKKMTGAEVFAAYAPKD